MKYPASRPSLLFAIVLATLGCTGQGVDLAVDMRTDLIPSIDFVGTTVRLVDAPAGEQMRFAFGTDIVEGFRVAEFSGLDPGTHDVEVDIVAPSGVVVMTRRLRVDLSVSSVVTVLATRDCLDVVCTDGLTCIGGRCMSSSCYAENLDACEASCADASECEGDTGECGAAVCSSGQCFVDVTAGCSGTEWCHPSSGCVPRDTGGDPVLTLVVEGAGAVGYGGESCGPDATCEIRGMRGSEITLTSEVNVDPFWGWLGGGCDDRTMPCTVTLRAPSTVRAIFGASVAEVTTVELVDAMGATIGLRLNGLLPMDDGSLLVADAEADRVWRVQRDGTVDVFAGSGFAGYADGPAVDATFTNPTGLARDPAGNVYVADTGNNRIRRVTPLGMVETFAGNGTGIASEGPLLMAGLPTPQHLAYRTNDDALLVVCGGVGLYVLGASGATRIDVEVSDRSNIVTDESGTAYWSSATGIWSLALGSTEAQLVSDPRCGRAGGWMFRITRAADGTLVENVAGGGGALCAVAPDGAYRRPILPGPHQQDGPDYEARLTLGGSPVAYAPDGTLVFVDGWPGRTLRLLTPR